MYNTKTIAANAYKYKHIRRILQNDYSLSHNKSLNSTTLSNSIKFDGGGNYLKSKFNDVVIWYEELTGMDEVRIMQNRVIESQDRFVAAQEKRRTMAKELNSIQSKLKEIYSELDTTSRGEERYLQLITQEHAILKGERKLTSEFALVEREERDSFTTLSSCVKESHEKERAQAERTKYWSIIGSIIGTVIGVAGSSINNEFKMKELRKLVKDLAIHDSVKSDVTAATILAHHQSELSSIVSEMKAAVSTYTTENDHDNVSGRLDKLLHTISSKHSQAPPLTDQSVQMLERKVEEIKHMITATKRYDGQLVAIPNDLESLIYKQSQETRLILLGVSILGIVVPLIITFFQR